VQVIPHITDEIKSRILAVSKEDNDTDVVIVEIGGTVGDIESIPYLEVARQMIHEHGRKDVISVLLTLIPEVGGGELKTKPTQHSVKTMLETGIQPDILICRSPVMLDEPTCRKIALFTNVDPDAVFTSPHVDTTIYQIPIVFFDQKLDEVILRKLGLECRNADMRIWYSVMMQYYARQGNVRIGIVGKYMEAHDTYTSLYEALFHVSLECGVQTELIKIDSSDLEEIEDVDSFLGKDGKNVDGILVPGGFCQRGIKGMIKAATWARENKKPYLGICLGMHVMIIDWARNILKWNDADSTEFSPDTKHPVISLPEEQVNVINYGGTMRLGTSELINKKDTHIMDAYGKECIKERHRHRYEFNNKYQDDMINSGLRLSAFLNDGNTDNSPVECVEWPRSSGSGSTERSSGQIEHPWGVGVQFYPEYKSKPIKASPLFRDFVTKCRTNSYKDKN
jgi:CTP synthase